MAKKLLGLVASYRKRGNSEIVTKSVVRAMGDDWSLSLIRLPLLTIKPCRGCYACLLPDKDCLIEDDVVWLLEQIKQADAVIMAAPNYVLGPVGIVKMLADRVLQAAPYHPVFEKIPAAVILTMGLEKYDGLAQTALCTQTAALGLNVVCAESFIGTHPGEVAMSDTFDAGVADIARALISTGTERLVRPGQCSRCLSDLFRPHPDGGLECAVCKSLATQDGAAVNVYQHDPVFTKEGQMQHLDWLLGKKHEYMDEFKRRLKEIRGDFRDGNWLTPNIS
jgi:multimeric flavodoxin WrbA